MCIGTRTKFVKCIRFYAGELYVLAKKFLRCRRSFELSLQRIDSTLSTPAMIDEGYLYEKEEPKSGFLRHAGSGRQSPAQTSSSYDDYSTRNNTDGNDMSSLSPSNREHANPRMRDRSHRYASSQSSHSRHKQQQQRDMPNAIASASRPPRYRSHRNQHQPQPPPTQHAARPSHVSHGPSHDHTTSRNRSKGTSGDRGGRGGDVDRDRDRGGEGEGEREGREGREKREKRARKREKEEQSMRTSAKSTGTVKENPVAMLNQHLRKKHQMGVERETGRKRGGDRESMYARRAHTSGTRHRLSGADTISNRMNNNNSGNDQGNTPNTVTDDEGGNDGGEADGGGMSSDFRRRMSTNERRILLQKERRKALERKVGDSNTDGARSNDIDSGRSHTKNVNSKSKGGRLIEGRDGNKKSRNEGGDGKNSADGVEDGQTTYRKLAAAAKKKEKDKDKHSYMFRMAKMAKTVVKSISNYSADSDTDADTDADVDTGVAHGTSAGADAGAMGGNGDHGTGRGRGAEATQGDGKDNDGSDRSADGFTALTKTRGYAKKTGKPVHSVHNLHIPRTRQKTDGRRAGDSYSHNNPRQGYNGNSRYNRSLNHDGYSPRQNESRGSNTSHAHTDRHSYLRSQAQSHARQGGPRSHGLRPPDSISEHPYHRESGSDDHIHDLDGDNAHADARAYMHADKRLDNAAGGRESENPPSLLRGLDKQRSLDYSSYNHQKFPFTPKHRRPSSRALSNNTTRTVYRNDNSSRPELEDKENSHSHKRTSANHHNHNPNHLRSHTRTHHHDRGDLHSHRSHEGAATSEIARSYAKGGGRESLVRFDDQTEAEGAVMTKPLPALQEESLRATPVDDSPSVPASFSSPSSSPSSLPSSTAVPASPTAAQGSMQVPPFAPDRDDDSSMKNTHGGSSGSDDAMGDHARDHKHVAGAGLEHDSTSSSNYTNTEFEDKIFGYRGLKKHKKKVGRFPCVCVCVFYFWLCAYGSFTCGNHHLLFAFSHAKH